MAVDAEIMASGNCPQTLAGPRCNQKAPKKTKYVCRRIALHTSRWGERGRDRHFQRAARYRQNG